MFSCGAAFIHYLTFFGVGCLLDRRSLPETFQLFHLIRLVTTDYHVITRITQEVKCNAFKLSKLHTGFRSTNF